MQDSLPVAKAEFTVVKLERFVDCQKAALQKVLTSKCWVSWRRIGKIGQLALEQISKRLVWTRSGSGCRCSKQTESQHHKQKIGGTHVACKDDN